MAGSRGYVRSIAGLRAIAVISIIAYHINAAWVPGGFVGVDVFFVISGFVVAHSVADTTHQNFIQYVGWFYKRRFVRILPALYAFLIVAALISMLFVPLVEETKFFEVTGASAAVGLSNLILWAKTADYFAVSSELNPFTHTWSLAVEEQYYFLFPIFSYLIFVQSQRNLKHRTLTVVAVIAASVLSLLGAAWASKHNPGFAFYMLPTRFWELGLGFLLRLALSPEGTERLRRRTSSFAAVLGLVAVASLTLALIITQPGKFPVPGAILPCLATALLIGTLWCHPGVWIDRLLSSPLPVWIGNVSYSLYLWHWLVLVFFRWTFGAQTLRMQILAALIMLLCSCLSYYFVELRFHNQTERAKVPSAGLFIRYGVAAVVVGLFCIGTRFLKPRWGLAAPDNVGVWDPYRQPPMPVGCAATKHASAFGSGLMIDFTARCVNSGASHLYIFGDSHSGAYERTAWRIAAMGKYHVELFTLGACRSVPLSHFPEVRGCRDFLQMTEAKLKASAGPGDVIVLANLSTTRYRNFEGDMVEPMPLDPTVMATSRSRVMELSAHGAAVIVEGVKPVMPSPLDRCADWFDRSNPVCNAMSEISPSARWDRTLLPRRGLAEVAAGIRGVSIWEPAQLLCPASQCPAYINGQPLFFDTDHLSAFGNDLLLPSFLQAVDQAHQQSLLQSEIQN
ncbi:Peptidoglycan/LPS O-acetylase OafA/YrhL, contains acyltransferase and SGNH-hydrolase domains [Bryocella elongata]|uniref:Peptidoglycan/LPS O-acetylase OafA/YrhL, contains acyltransferase and SGNH-hydrolase domains n=1 Tax=Bryocella elongata TaxID=863522 RepID=A0A1H5UCV8_9BACT|nr:acyltransferase family protein [Bryocella elongata]SEF72880.1 Peptidoglycan/LPS O-acetylase OafA/YrhL, contains acyltransferase and SGNH-hydrolase domains [Bryocella elongata]